MLRTTALLCAARGLACETAMERRMGCGMGTCQSCVVRVRDAAAEQGWRYALCCTEGPVFDAASVLWE
jgi:dihydroorotate dehydrogenase electron transfer subunit